MFTSMVIPSGGFRHLDKYQNWYAKGGNKKFSPFLFCTMLDIGQQVENLESLFILWICRELVYQEDLKSFVCRSESDHIHF